MTVCVPARRSRMAFRNGVAALLLLGLGMPAVAQQAIDYIVGPQDVLTITIWDQTDLSGKFAVEADGTFTFPLIGRVKAGGLTLREVEQDLKLRLADGFFRNPQISVAIEQYRSQRIFVIGEVRQPGPYPLTGDMTLIEALARAGSTTATASGEAIIVRRPAGSTAEKPLLPTQANGSEVTSVDIKELQNGSVGRNVLLHDGDTIFLPRSEAVYVFGQVKNPGAYAIQKDTTVLQALSLAGGVTDRGSTARIKVVRLLDGEKVELKIKLNDLVRPGDTVLVPERFF
jgi:polysaccharide export outer membrane protein